MKYYLHALYKSFTEPAWLAQQYRQTGKASKFFVLTVLVLSLLFAFRVTYIEIATVVPAFQDTIVNDVPDFNATVSNGVVTITELPQPYVQYVEHEGESMVFVVDTVSTSTPTLESFFTTSTQSGFLLTSQSIFSKTTSSSAIMEESLGRLPNTTFSKTQVIELLDTINGKFKPGIFALLTAFTFMVWGIGLLIFVLIFTSFAYLLYSSVTKVEKQSRYSWKDVLTFSLCTFALPKLVITVVSLASSLSFAFLVSAAMAFAVARVLSIPRTTEHQNSSETVVKP